MSDMQASVVSSPNSEHQPLNPKAPNANLHQSAPTSNILTSDHLLTMQRKQSRACAQIHLDVQGAVLVLVVRQYSTNLPVRRSAPSASIRTSTRSSRR